MWVPPLPARQIRQRGHHGRTAEARHSVCSYATLRAEAFAADGKGCAGPEPGVSDGTLPVARRRASASVSSKPSTSVGLRSRVASRGGEGGGWTGDSLFSVALGWGWSRG